MPGAPDSFGRFCAYGGALPEAPPLPPSPHGGSHHEEKEIDLVDLLHYQHEHLVAFVHQWLFQQEAILAQLHGKMPRHYSGTEGKASCSLTSSMVTPSSPSRSPVSPRSPLAQRRMGNAHFANGLEKLLTRNIPVYETMGLAPEFALGHPPAQVAEEAAAVTLPASAAARGSRLSAVSVTKKPVSLLASRSSDELERKAQAHEVSLKQQDTHKHSVFSQKSSPVRNCSENFEYISLGILLLNTLFIGIETEWAVRNPEHTDVSLPFFAVNAGFAAFFLLELLWRLGHDRKSFFLGEQRHWNCVDFVAASASLVEVLADSFRMAESGAVQGTVSSTGQRFIRIVRVARLVRIFRITRIVRFIASLRMLVYSIMCTMRSLGWSLVLLGAIIYSFGLFFTQGVHDHLTEATGGTAGTAEDPTVGLREYWGSLGSSMLTLFMSITGGVSWKEAADPLVGAHLIYQVAFVCFVAFSLLAVLNVVTAVFCHSAITSAQQDQDSLLQTQVTNRESYMRWVKHCFQGIDTNNSGNITLLELESHINDDRMQAFLASLEIETDDVWTLFKLLDTDGSNCISKDEFAKGCSRLRGSARSVDLALQSQEIQWLMEKLTVFIKYTEEQLTTLTGQKPDHQAIFMPQYSFLRHRRHGSSKHHGRNKSNRSMPSLTHGNYRHTVV